MSEDNAHNTSYSLFYCSENNSSMISTYSEDTNDTNGVKHNMCNH